MSLHWHLFSLCWEIFSDSDLRSKYIFFSNNVGWGVMLNSGCNEVLIGAQSFPVQLWPFISIQTCGRPAFPVLGFCRAELQSAYYQSAQVSSTIRFVSLFFWACMSCDSHGWFTFLKTHSLPWLLLHVWIEIKILHFFSRNNIHKLILSLKCQLTNSKILLKINIID